MNLPIPLYAIVLDKNIRISQAAGKFFKLSLRTQIGQINANLFDVEEDILQKGDILQIEKIKNQLDSTHNNIVLYNDKIKKINKEEIPESLREEVLKVPKADENDVEKAWWILNNSEFYEYEKHHKFVQKCLSKYSKEQILKHPSAVAMHHHYQGGWAIHEAEVLVCARSLTSAMKKFYGNMINNDVVCVSAALHDIGKLETYYLDVLGLANKYDTESSIGHLYYSVELVNKMGKEENLDPQFLKEVVHCIATHHGRTEYGSIKKCMTLEAIIVSQADYLSSRCGILDTELRNMSDLGVKLENIETLKLKGGDRFLITNNLSKYQDELG